MGERLFDVDPMSGMKTFFSTDDDGDTWNFRREQDVSFALNCNKAAQNEDFDKRDDTWHAAHIPPLVIYEWIAKHGVNIFNPDHEGGVKRLLNDPDYRYLRVRNFIM